MAAEPGTMRAGAERGADAAGTRLADLPRPRWRGTRGPSTGSPERLPGSARRTTSIDMLRPDGLTGPLHLVGRGRDLLTAADGTARVLDTAAMHVEIDFLADRVITDLRTDPDLVSLTALVGGSARSGFRRAVRGALPPELTGSLLAQLLDDVPVATIVSGSALIRAGVRWTRRPGSENSPPMVDICAGWRDGGEMDRNLRESGVPGLLLPHSPLAGDLTRTPRSADATAAADAATGGTTSPDGADTVGWHELPPLPPSAVRRVRRLDVTRVGGGGVRTASGVEAAPGAAFLVDVVFRDSHQEPTGVEVVVHEYGLTASLAADGTVLTAVATTGVVPGPQCSLAAASAQRVVGRPVRELREAVARTFSGPSTCTHLNDTLRTLGDLPVLLTALA
jgi:hypothetical protein